MILPFSKCHANGNDFILTHSVDFPKEARTETIIKRLCCRHTGIGANGLFVISPSEKYDFMLDYYNSDGSWERLCANGSRCSVLFMRQCGSIKNMAVFLAGDGPHSAEILTNGNVKMQMLPPKYRSDLISPEGCDGYFVDSGARHFVCESANLSNDFVYDNGHAVRNSHIFQPEGINVNFYTVKGKNQVYIKTYEKGVEEVMQSCASGSTAVVFHLAKKKRIYAPVLVRSSGGNLTFYFNEDCDDIWTEGPAEILFSGNFELGLLSI